MPAGTRLNEELRRRSAPARARGVTYVIGVAGSVAVGKSTFAAALAKSIAAWPEHPTVINVATDGYLFPNAILAERGLSMRKGFPESYDVAALRAALEEIKDGERVPIPRYSHVTYDVDAENAVVVRRPTFLILDGLHLAQIETPGRKRLVDCLIYLDAQEAVIEGWFTNRLLPLMLAGRDDAKSFYYAFREMSDDDRRNFAARVWREINLPNLHDHIVKDRAAADLVITKNPDHSVASVRP
ncbi:MAG: type I pantothenate kinase [Alphaproteobacteria bacterium]|nr:type I pantothenate kinase [Alphaproteobacteria bacterium]MBL7096090.1 type I pantothenate kinase [Alphaproteobacteria bacterium]